ncbi:chitobiase/beta-hexosaminidase C-terminal domain-containing protein [bacterium]|nr:chitobiase/beta-hexosaminidase C-terminal domain-containing protein [bacterium]
MKVYLTIISLVISLFFPLAVFSQSVQENPKPVYVSPEGKIYVKSNQPVYLRLATSPEDSAPDYILRSEGSMKSGKIEPFKFEGHGKHTIRHMADHRIPQQNKDNHLFYVNDDGKAPNTKLSVTKAPWVYNGNVNIYGKPVTITLKSTDESSGVFAGYYSLNSEIFSKYNQPIYLDKEMDYTLKFFAVDNVGNQSKERTRLYSLDFTPPVTNHSIVGGHINVAGEDVVSPRSKIALKSRDEKAGVKQIRYRFKGEKGVYSGKLLTMNGLNDGVHSLVYAAGDRVENAEVNKTFTFYLDSIPPVVSHALMGDQYFADKTTYVSGSTKIELTATDNKAGVRRIRYYPANEKAQTYEAPLSFPQRNGKFNYSFAASDQVLNVSDTIKKSVVVDISPPEVSPKFMGEHYYVRKTHYVRLNTQISLPTTDNLSGVQSVSYAVDPSTDTEVGMLYTQAFTLPTEGIHTLNYRAIDNVNNDSKIETITLYVDEVSPVIYHHFGTNPTVPTDSVYPLKSLLYLAATDKQSGIRNIYYSINGEKEVLYKNPLSFKKSIDYSIKIRSIDNVGNISTSQVDFTIR